MRKPKIPTDKWGGVEEVDKWYREEKDIEIAKKLNAIRLLMRGESAIKTAEVLGVCEATIRNWRTAWDKKGREGLKPAFKGRNSKVTESIRADISEVIEIRQEIDGRTVTGYLIHGYLKKNTV